MSYDLGAAVRGKLALAAVLTLLTAALLATACGGDSDDAVPAKSSAVIKMAAGRSATCPAGASMNIVAHQDDDLLFLNPDIAKDIAAGHCVRTVFLTAGDNNLDSTYWLGREAGIRAAYAGMAGVANAWTTSDAGLAGHPAVLQTLASRATVSLVFLRLADGQGGGEGSSNNNFESLKKLFEGTISTIRAKDGTTSYSKSGLVSALADLINSFAPNTVRAQNFNGAFGDGDHADHLAAAFLVRDAFVQVTVPHTLVAYADYVIRDYPVNVSGADFIAKKTAWDAYVAYDPLPCGSPPACNGNAYTEWLTRRYTTGSLIKEPTTGTNLALGRTVTASSVEAPGLEANKAVDGNAVSRWSSAFADNQWLQVDLGAPMSIDTVDVDWEAAYAAQYQVLVSADGVSWTTVASVTRTSAGTERTAFAAVNVRHVRIACLRRGTPWGFSIHELKVSKNSVVAPPPPPPPPPSSTNLALGRATSASSLESGGLASEKAVDGNRVSRWSSAFADNQWLQVDLGTLTTVSNVEVSWETAYAASYQVQVSTDGANWTTVANATPDSAGTQRLAFAAVGARYVRIACIRRATVWGFSVWEIGVYP
jgi:LmbE family N-acetylglucosaminyl deacetylase